MTERKARRYWHKIIHLVVLLLALALAGCCMMGGPSITFEKRIIYHSPQTPGYTAWVGFWLNNGLLNLDFHQVTRDGSGFIHTTPLLVSNDGEQWQIVSHKSWSDGLPESTYTDGANIYFQVSRESGRGMAILLDGTFVRPVWPSPGDTGYIAWSKDGGGTWNRVDITPAGCRTWPTNIKQLRDGRIVCFAGVTTLSDIHQYDRKVIFISNNEGSSWSKALEVIPIEQGYCEESDFVEMPNGDLFFVNRSELMDGRNIRTQSIMKKVGMIFLEGTAIPAPFPGSGYPLLIATDKGLLYASTEGFWLTTDYSRWRPLSWEPTHYYPKAIVLGEKVIVISHVGGDNAFGTFDQTIIEQVFDSNKIF